MKTRTAPYTRHIEYRFTVKGQVIAASRNGSNIYVEETRKNGQEDTHMSGQLTQRGNRWVWDALWEDTPYESFSTYHSRALADAILRHINKYPLPGAED